MWFEFYLTSLVVVIAPGTGVVYTVAIGLARGVGPSCSAALGCTFGILPHMAAAVLGVAALLQASATAFQTFKVVGVLYLLYMAWSMLQEKGMLNVTPDENTGSIARIATTGFLINILNPKLSIFFLAFLPQFIPINSASPIALMMLLSALFMAMTFLVFVGYGAFAASVRQHVITRPRVMTWIRRCFAASFVVLGLRLAFTAA